jgi:hypothetical protein
LKSDWCRCRKAGFRKVEGKTFEMTVENSQSA